jgi:hypothetical protein
MELWRTHWTDEYGMEDQSSPRQREQADGLAERLARNIVVGRVWLESTDGKRVEIVPPEKRVR